MLKKRTRICFEDIDDQHREGEAKTSQPNAVLSWHRRAHPLNVRLIVADCDSLASVRKSIPNIPLIQLSYQLHAERGFPTTVALEYQVSHDWYG